MINKKKILSIPIEIYKREFFYMLYLSLLAIDKGFQVVIGDQNSVIFTKLNNGVYFHKDHAPWSLKLLTTAKNRFMKIVILDVEGLIYSSEDEYISTRVSKEIIEIADSIFCWGNTQKNLINKVVKDSNNILITGSPKIDISNLISDQVSSKSKDKFYNNILINTRFAVNNGVSYDVELNNQKNLGIISSDTDVKLFNDFYNSDVKIYDEFIDLIFNLATNKSINITIRPHPRENCKTYIDLFNKFENVKVDNKTLLNEQFINHDCVIHDGCTTAIEARACGIPVFGLRPNNLKNAYSSYSNNYSLNFSSYIELTEHLMKSKVMDYDFKKNLEEASGSIKNWLNKDINASYSIINKINRLDIPFVKLLKPNFIKYFDIKLFIFYLINHFIFFKFILRTFFKTKYDNFIRSRSNVDNKFPDLNYANIKSDIKLLNDLDLKTVRFKDICIDEISRKSFVIYKSE